jgi:hypothetical protein
MAQTLLQDLVGKTVDLTVRNPADATCIYIIGSCTIMSVDATWISYKVPEGEQALIRQEDIVAIKLRG